MKGDTNHAVLHVFRVTTREFGSLIVGPSLLAPISDDCRWQRKLPVVPGCCVLAGSRKGTGAQKAVASEACDHQGNPNPALQETWRTEPTVLTSTKPCDRPGAAGCWRHPRDVQAHGPLWGQGHNQHQLTSPQIPGGGHIFTAAPEHSPKMNGFFLSYRMQFWHQHPPSNFTLLFTQKTKKSVSLLFQVKHMSLPSFH